MNQEFGTNFSLYNSLSPFYQLSGPIYTAFGYLVILLIIASGCSSYAGRSTNDYTKEDLPYLINLLHSNHPQDRAWAAMCLQNLGHDAKAAIPDLVKALDDDVWYVRVDAVSAIGFIAPEDSDLLPRIVKSLKDSNPAVREVAAFTISQFHVCDEETKAALLSAIEDNDACVRIQVIRALGGIGPDGEIISSLIRALGDEEREVRITAEDYLKKFIKEEGLPKILKIALQDRDPIIRKGIVLYIGTLGEGNEAALPVLNELIEIEPDASVREAAEELIKKIENAMNQ